jgi:uncharacterized protein (DUF433 family)
MRQSAVRQCQALQRVASIATILVSRYYMIDVQFSIDSQIMNYHDIITIEPGKRSGKPCIRGMRITVYDILEYLAGGMSEVEILEDFSELTLEDIRACLAFAADREKKLFVASH